MSALAELVEIARKNSNIEVRPPQQLVAPLPVIPEVAELYRFCDGMTLYRKSLHPIEIVPAADCVKANIAILGQDFLEDRTTDWYLLARWGTQYISVDERADRSGWCYDSFWETHGIPGESPVLATSVAQLLQRLIGSHGRSQFWLDDGFEPIGDAYDIGLTSSVLRP